MPFLEHSYTRWWLADNGVLTITLTEFEEMSATVQDHFIGFTQGKLTKERMEFEKLKRERLMQDAKRRQYG